MHILRQSTAVDVLIGPFVDKTDGNTLETGKTLDVELSKNGQGLANKNDSTAPTDDTGGNVDGYYNCELDATDTNTFNVNVINASADNANANAINANCSILKFKKNHIFGCCQTIN